VRHAYEVSVRNRAGDLGEGMAHVARLASPQTPPTKWGKKPSPRCGHVREETVRPRNEIIVVVVVVVVCFVVVLVVVVCCYIFAVAKELVKFTCCNGNVAKEMLTRKCVQMKL